MLFATLASGLGACTGDAVPHGAGETSPTPSSSASYCDTKCQALVPHVATHGVRVGVATTSIIEKLPVPKGSRLTSHDRDGYDIDAWYEAAAGVTADDLVAWFKVRVRPYHYWRGWSGWRWCTGIHNTDPYSSQGIWGWNQGPDEMRTLHAVIMESDGKVVIHLSRMGTGLCANG
jgi:hypothetical protein